VSNPVTTSFGVRIAKILIVVIGMLVLATSLLFSVRDLTRITNWSRSGFVLSSFLNADTARIRFFGVDPADFRGPPYPVLNDTILTLNDTTASGKRWILLLESPHQPGRDVSVTFLHQGDTLRTVFHTRPVQKALVLSMVVLQILKVLIGLSFVILGLWAYARRPDSGSVRTLAFYCFSMACFPVFTYMPMFREMASFTIPLEGLWLILMRVIGFFFASFWLLLNLRFPTRLPLMDKRGRVFALVFLPLLLLMACDTLLNAILRLNQPYFRFLYFGLLVSQVFIGLGLLRHHYLHAASGLEKRQTKLVLWGSGVSLILFCIYFIDVQVLIPTSLRMPLLMRLILTDIIFLAVLFSPLSLAYAFGKYRLLEVQGRLKRGTRHLLVTIALLGVAFFIAYLLGSFLLVHLRITSSAPTLLVALVLALGFAPAQKSIQFQLEKRFYPQRLRLRQMIHDFLRFASTVVDRTAVAAELESRLKLCLDVDAVMVVVRNPRGPDFFVPGKGTIPLTADSTLVQFIGRECRPLLADEAIASDRVCCPPAEQTWLMENDIALILPLCVHDRLIGMLALGYRRDREDFDPEELAILTTLADQVALTIENLSLLEENIEKRRMEEELQVARRVQEGFLPKVLPQSPGLELAARSTFSLEVAGDYYDVIPLQNQRTLLAVGDVSGKGAGAALIMASVQSALRALCSVNLPLSEVMSRINNLIFQNTESEQYITFFVAVFDAPTKTLHYVNAGHNPPLHIGPGRETAELDCGGLILGAFPEQSYREAAVQTATGDILVFYTDGITEAMDARGEELGEQRLCEAIRHSRGKPTEQILDDVSDLLARHQGNPLVEDDQTLMVAKIL
jgi:serine phosphatase RsbU (regulator of sigma subunit)